MLDVIDYNPSHPFRTQIRDDVLGQVKLVYLPGTPNIDELPDYMATATLDGDILSTTAISNTSFERAIELLRNMSKKQGEIK